MTDPDYSAGEDNAATAEHKAASVHLCILMCELFGEDLDRTSLWDRIASALATAAAKTTDGDMDRFVSLCLDHVRADAAKAARHPEIGAMLHDWSEQSAAWRQGFVRYVATRSFAILAHGRVRWERVKEMKAGAK
ncbi:MAG TPA: hypothetical protein VGM05_22095 [Planctomycetaceae bacterium]